MLTNRALLNKDNVTIQDTKVVHAYAGRAGKFTCNPNKAAEVVHLALLKASKVK